MPIKLAIIGLGKIARDSHIPAVAGLTNGDFVYGHASRLHFDLLTRSCSGVRRLAADLQRRISRWNLLDRSGEARKDSIDLLDSRPDSAGRDDLAFRVKRVGLLPEADGEIIGLGCVQHPPAKLGRLSERDRQHAAGQRVQRPAMPDLGFGLARLA